MLFISRIKSADLALSKRFNKANQRPEFRFACLVLGLFGNGFVWLAIYTYFLIFPHDINSALFVRLIKAELLGLVLITILRYLTKRERPCQQTQSFAWFRYSFPSHHALRSFFIAVIIGSSYPHWQFLLYLLAGLIGFSRLYLSKHYLSDIFAGGVLGVLIGCFLLM